jgi:hypothetical protein
MRRRAFTAEQAAALIPGLTAAHLDAMRIEGDGPDYFEREDGEIAYRESDLEEWATRID